MGISEQSTLLCEQKLLTSRQIFRYAVPAHKKALNVIGRFIKTSPRRPFCDTLREGNISRREFCYFRIS